MNITIEAIYENGLLRPLQHLPLKEHEKVQVTVTSSISRVRQTAGLIGWTGSQEDADFVALSPELDPQERVSPAIWQQTHTGNNCR
jgi:predicted DNA-binding antitoxin AbrB/MazE fold protein